MKTYVHTTDLKYDGSQLRPLFAYGEFKVRGDSIVFFRGSADVKTHMLDMEDVVLKEFISSDDMLHCIVEIFKSPPSLAEARMFQLLIVENATRILNELYLSGSFLPRDRHSIICDGDDIFLVSHDDGVRNKLSISIATVSGISYLIHFAVNIFGTGIPPEVKAGCLNDIRVNPEKFSELLGERMVCVYDEHILPALNKVKTV